MQDARANQAKNMGAFGSPSVKIPDLYDVERGNDAIPEAIMEYLLFEQIGSQELLLSSRSDMLNGTNPSYSILSNLVDLNFQYSSSNIISLPNSLPDIFKRYSIVLENYVPNTDKLPTDEYDKSEINESPNSYVDQDPNSNNHQSIVVEFKNIQPNQQIEMQVLADGDEYYVNQGLDESAAPVV
jgi:hypothetical protein